MYGTLAPPGRLVLGVFYFRKTPAANRLERKAVSCGKCVTNFPNFRQQSRLCCSILKKRQSLALCLETYVQPSFVSHVVLMSQYRVTVFETKLFRNGTSDSYKTAQHDSYKPFCLHSVHLKIDRKLFFLPWQNNIFPVR